MKRIIGQTYLHPTTRSFVAPHAMKKYTGGIKVTKHEEEMLREEIKELKGALDMYRRLYFNLTVIIKTLNDDLKKCKKKLNNKR